jgi:hypothetical protein
MRKVVSERRAFPVVDLDVSLNWEINFGVGVDPTSASDHLIVKGILGAYASAGCRRSGAIRGLMPREEITQ